MYKINFVTRFMHVLRTYAHAVDLIHMLRTCLFTRAVDLFTLLTLLHTCLFTDTHSYMPDDIVVRAL